MVVKSKQKAFRQKFILQTNQRQNISKNTKNEGKEWLRHKRYETLADNEASDSLLD